MALSLSLSLLRERFPSSRFHFYSRCCVTTGTRNVNADSQSSERSPADFFSLSFFLFFARFFPSQTGALLSPIKFRSGWTNGSDWNSDSRTPDLLGHYRRLKAPAFRLRSETSSRCRAFFEIPRMHDSRLIAGWTFTRSPNISALETRARFSQLPRCSPTSLLLSLSLSLSSLPTHATREQRYRTGEKESSLFIFACTGENWMKKERPTPVFSCWFRLRFETLDLSYTLQTRPIYTTIDRGKPVNRKLVKFDL